MGGGSYPFSFSLFLSLSLISSSSSSPLHSITLSPFLSPCPNYSPPLRGLSFPYGSRMARGAKKTKSYIPKINNHTTQHQHAMFWMRQLIGKWSDRRFVWTASNVSTKVKFELRTMTASLGDLYWLFTLWDSTAYRETWAILTYGTISTQCDPYRTRGLISHEHN